MDYPLPRSQSPPTNDSNLYQLASQNGGYVAAENVFADGYMQWTALSFHDQGGCYLGPAAQSYGNNPISHRSGFTEGQMASSFSQYPTPIATQPHQLPIYDGASGEYLQPMAPLPKSRKRKNPTSSLNDWEPVKARAIELYFTLDLKLLEVKTRIEEEFKLSDFTAT